MSLVLDGLVKRFGTVTALDGISFEVPKGQVFGFLGANGAGKTTTMRIVLDILRPDAGTATWDGTPTTAVPRETWGYLPEERGLYPRLQVLDQLVFFASLYGIPRDVAAARAREWLARLRIPDYATRRAEELSKGNQQKVQLIAAISWTFCWLPFDSSSARRFSYSGIRNRWSQLRPRAAATSRGMP